MSATWDVARHAVEGCRGSWSVELNTEHRWDDDELRGLRAICATCGAVLEVTAWSHASDDGETIPDQHRPRLTIDDTPLARRPEAITERAAGLLLRGAGWGWAGARDGEPRHWDAIADGRVVGRLERGRGPRGGELWWWAVLGADQRVTTNGQSKTRTAGARAIAAALAVVAP